MKYFALVAFVAIIVSLGSALFFMMKGQADEKSRSHKMARALGWRVGISILLFISILLAWKFGYLQPGGIAAGQ